jgi:hypothetical protein
LFNVRCVRVADYPIRENLKHEKEITLPIQTHSDIFGVPLEDLMGYDGEKGGIPRVVKDCIQYIRESGIIVIVESTTASQQLFIPGLEEEGLFRRSPSSVMLKQAQEAYDRGKPYRCCKISLDVLKYILCQVLSSRRVDQKVSSRSPRASIP